MTLSLQTGDADAMMEVTATSTTAKNKMTSRSNISQKQKKERHTWLIQMLIHKNNGGSCSNHCAVAGVIKELAVGGGYAWNPNVKP